MMTGKAPNLTLLPVDLVVRARAQSLADFLASGDHLFLVSLPSVDGDLALGLAEASTASGPKARRSRDALGFGTTTMSAKELLAKAPQRDLRTLLLLGPHFAVPLRKRPADAAFSERISIGRARNNDIVLRQADVSKFHAWLECDDEGQFYLSDARSKNATTHNGQPMGRGQEPLRHGDDITFGSVHVVFVLAAPLWELLREI
jgi:FHA domain